MIDFAELMDRLNEILGHEGKLLPNTECLGQGTYLKQPDGSYTFGLDSATILVYPAKRISEQTAQLISLLIQRGEGNPMQKGRQDHIQSLIRDLFTKTFEPEFLSIGRKLDMQIDGLYLPMIVKRAEGMEEWEEAVQSYFSAKVRGAFIDGYGYYLIPISQLSLDEKEKESLEEVLRGLSSLLCEEGFAGFSLAFSEPVHEMERWKPSFDLAKKSLEAGRHFHPERQLYLSWNLPLERMLFELTDEGKKEFLKGTLGENAWNRFYEEMFSTLHVLLEKNLNISEAARKLFIHRNTLIYRLERFKEETGRDVRMGNEAMMVYLALLLGKGFQQVD